MLLCSWGDFHRNGKAKVSTDLLFGFLAVKMSYSVESLGQIRAQSSASKLYAHVLSATLHYSLSSLSQGSAVSMPWVNEVHGLLQTWYSGNEAGNAIADVLFGKTNPSGRLPLTFPARIEDVPAYLNHRSENGKIQ